jgi:hypothetical protein
MTPIAQHIEAFLRENLSHHRGASQHTCDSYAYSFQLLFEFAAARLGSRHRRWRWSSSTRDWSAPSWSIWRTRAETLQRPAMFDWRRSSPSSASSSTGSLPRSSKSVAFWRSPSRGPTLVWFLIWCARKSRPCSTLPIRRPAMESGIGRCCIWLFVPPYACLS